MSRIAWCAGLLLLLGCEEPRPSEEGEGETPAEEQAEEAVPERDFPGEPTALDAQLTQAGALSLWSDFERAPANVDPVAWAASIPEDNQMSAARVALGEKLYFDGRLSADGTVACATCHDTGKAFGDSRNASEGIRGQVGRRNAPTTMNAALLEVQFWDGRAATLEDQAKMPILNPIEMGFESPEAAVAAIAGDADYQRMFQEAYGREPNYDDIGRAIAAFERTLIFLDAPFDRFVQGDASAISDEAKAGWALFNGKARCVSCHTVSPANPLFTDHRFHNIGVAARHQSFDELARGALVSLERDDSEAAIDRLALDDDASELGRFLITRSTADIGAFRTPQLRNIGVTAPYMHDGSMRTLWDVMDHYNKGGEPNPNLDGGIEPLALTEEEIDQLVAFMFSLTDDRLSDFSRAEQARQRRLAAERRPFRDDAVASRARLTFGASAIDVSRAAAAGEDEQPEPEGEEE